MQEIKGCFLTLSLISLACIIFETLIPTGKISVAMKTVISMFIICTAILPFYKICKNFNLKSKDLKIYKDKNQSSKLEKTIENQIYTLSSTNIKEAINITLNKMKVKPKKIEILMDKNETDSIILIKSKIYIDKEYENKETEIKNEIYNKFHIDTDIIKN